MRTAGSGSLPPLPPPQPRRRPKIATTNMDNPFLEITLIRSPYISRLSFSRLNKVSKPTFLKTDITKMTCDRTHRWT